MFFNIIKSEFKDNNFKNEIQIKPNSFYLIISET